MFGARAFNPKGDEQVTVSGTAIGITLPSGAVRAVIQVTANAIYFTEDGGTPSSSNGLEANAGDILNYLDANYASVLGKFKAIRQSSDAVLKIEYYD